MVWIFLSFVLVALSALSARFLIGAIRTGPVCVPSGEYTFMAQRVSRWYKVMSWGLVTAFLLSTLAQLFLSAVHEIF